MSFGFHLRALLGADTMRAILAVVSVLYVGVALGLMAWKPHTLEGTPVIMLIIGMIVSKYGSIYDYYFGSSDGSKVKTRALTKDT